MGSESCITEHKKAGMGMSAINHNGRQGKFMQPVVCLPRSARDGNVRTKMYGGLS